jgi:hypothetical protein
MYIILFMVVLLILAIFNFGVTQNARKQNLTPLAGLAFGFILAGLFCGEERLIGYSLLGIGVVLAIIDIIRKAGAKTEK